jgi:hypothetical protein
VDYDADRAPDPDEWLDTDEVERIAAVEAHHRTVRDHARMPRPRLHAAIHAVVETQLASGTPPETRRALERLVTGGLPRHEAVHAVGVIVSNATAAALDGRAFDAAVYARELDALTVERWRSMPQDG